MPTLYKTQSANDDNFQFERSLHSKGYNCVAGVDEVGRGPLAGPVVAACVSLPPDCDTSIFLDSKKTSPKQRQSLFAILHQYRASIGIGIVSEKLIDKINILQASLLAMKIAVFHHGCESCYPDHLLVDGKNEIPLATPQLTLTKGESKSGSIAAASIVAKIKRDSIMANIHASYPEYNFLKNQGYPTKEHRGIVKKIGPCPFHRRSFRGVKEFVD